MDGWIDGWQQFELLLSLDSALKMEPFDLTAFLLEGLILLMFLTFALLLAFHKHIMLLVSDVPRSLLYQLLRDITFIQRRDSTTS